MPWGEYVTWTLQVFIWCVLGVIVLMGLHEALR